MALLCVYSKGGAERPGHPNLYWGDLRCGYVLILISSLLTKLHTRMQMGSNMPALGIKNSTPFYRGGNRGSDK